MYGLWTKSIGWLFFRGIHSILRCHICGNTYCRNSKAVCQRVANIYIFGKVFAPWLFYHFHRNSNFPVIRNSIIHLRAKNVSHNTRRLSGKLGARKRTLHPKVITRFLYPVLQLTVPENSISFFLFAYLKLLIFW